MHNPAHRLHFIIAAGTLGAILTGGAVIAQNYSAQRVASRIILSATPQAIGVSTGREELAIQVDSDSAGPAFCGYNSATLSKTPGTGSGFRYAASNGRVICKYPEQILYCMSTDGAIVSIDEAYIRTATPTATPTNTPTRTP